MERDSLILYAKTEDLFFEFYPTLRNFPKIEKQGVCLQIKNVFMDILSAVGQAKEIPTVSIKKTKLHSAKGFIDNLLTLIRLSRSRKYISKGFFEEVDLKITEIKKILVGLLKSFSRK